MSPQQLLLSWEDHNGALISVFENYLKNNTLVDCTLAADGQYVKAHKVVLSACSSYFELLFSQENEKNPIVILKDVKFQELEAAIHFMYRGEVEICEDRLAAFLEVADSLQIKGLGTDRKSQNVRGKSPTPKSSKAVVPPKAHSCRKQVTFTESENTRESCITIDSDKNSNESSSHHHLPQRETLGSSPIPPTLAFASSYCIPPDSTSYPVEVETNRERDKLEKNQCSSSSASIFPSGDTVPSDVNTIIKIEPVIDFYLDERLNESERDFDDVTTLEDLEDRDDPNVESTVDDHSSNQQDPGRVRRVSATVAPRSRRFQCSQCSYSANHSSNLTRHHRVHSGEKPYKCAFCPFSSAWLPSLRNHNSRHSGEKPYQCNVCPFATVDPRYIEVHKRKHNVEKPYECNLCPYTSAQSSSLTVHKRKHHGEEL